MVKNSNAGLAIPAKNLPLVYGKYNWPGDIHMTRKMCFFSWRLLNSPEHYLSLTKEEHWCTYSATITKNDFGGSNIGWYELHYVTGVQGRQGNKENNLW